MSTLVREPPTPRAERYPLVMPIRLRAAPADQWAPGRTENVSLTGVLAELDGLSLPSGTPVEMVLGLSDEEPGDRHVICVGHIVRVEHGARRSPRVAVTIERYRQA